MVYPSPTELNVSEGLGTILHYTNQVTNNWMSNMLIIGVYVIILMGFYKAKDDFKGAMAVAGYGTFVVGLLFWIGGFVSGITFGMCIGVSLIGTIVLLLDNN